MISKEVISKLEPIAKVNNLSKEIMSSVKENRVRDDEELKNNPSKTENKGDEKVLEVGEGEEEQIKENISNLNIAFNSINTFKEKNLDPDKIQGDFDDNIIKSLEKELK